MTHFFEHSLIECRNFCGAATLAFNRDSLFNAGKTVVLQNIQTFPIELAQLEKQALDKIKGDVQSKQVFWLELDSGSEVLKLPFDGGKSYQIALADNILEGGELRVQVHGTRNKLHRWPFIWRKKEDNILVDNFEKENGLYSYYINFECDNEESHYLIVRLNVDDKNTKGVKAVVVVAVH